MMSSEKNKFKLRPLDVHQHELDNACNFGRRLMEKMGWQDGLGLGRNNQGMLESPLWNYRRNEQFKGGFKTKDENFVPEVLMHQNAFEDLLGDLNAQICEENEVLHTSNLTSCDTAKVPTRQPRYFKMARAKDTSNYSVKDLEGIIGREVTQKNLSLLQLNKDNKIMGSTESNIHKLSAFKNGNYCSKDKCEFLETGAKSNDCDESEKALSSSSRSSCNEGHSSKDHNITKRKSADAQITLTDSKVDKVKIKKRKRRENQEEIVEINNSADQSLDTVHEDSTLCDNLSKDADTRITSEDSKVEELKIKKHKKRKRNREESTETNTLANTSVNMVHENLTVQEDNLSNDTHSTLEELLKVGKVKIKKHKRKREENVEINTSAKTGSNIAIEKVTVKKDNLSKVDYEKEFCQKVSQVVGDEDLKSEICQGFIGSNLSSIKGYGNW